MAISIRILLASYNGARFIGSQIASIAGQTAGPVGLTVGDDGSCDDTLAEISAFERTAGLLEIVLTHGPRNGFSENFRALILKAPPDEDVYAFADQDDVWHADKLERALAFLASVPCDRPALYCGRTRLIDEAGVAGGHSPLFSRAPSFRNAIVQNVAGGNTMVMNRAAFLHLRQSAQRTSFLTHDWWTYLIVTGVGGAVFYDPVPRVDYRQHGRNVVGHAAGLRPRARRLAALLAGRYRGWTDRNLASLERCEDMLTLEARGTLSAFVEARSRRGPAALRRLNEAGIYRQSRLGTLTLRCGIALGRI